MEIQLVSITMIEILMEILGKHLLWPKRFSLDWILPPEEIILSIVLHPPSLHPPCPITSLATPDTEDKDHRLEECTVSQSV